MDTRYMNIFDIMIQKIQKGWNFQLSKQQRKWKYWWSGIKKIALISVIIVSKYRYNTTYYKHHFQRAVMVETKWIDDYNIDKKIIYYKEHNKSKSIP